MVLVNMLMKIDPLPMRGSMVMTMVMISPSRWDVSPAEQLHQSPRLVPSCGGGVSSHMLVYDFLQGNRPHIGEDGHRRPVRGPTRQGVRPHPRDQGVGPLTLIPSPVFFIKSKNDFHGVSGLLELCRIGL